MSDHYRTLAERAEWRLKIDRSDFLGIAFPVTTELEFFDALRAIAKQHFDATHHCWAFRLFTDSRSRSADAGEPSGTAGRPILNAIEKAELFDLAVVVVRWFGGVKLGTGGLSRAYFEAAGAALRDALVEDRYIYDTFRVEVPFDLLGTAYRLARPPDVVLAATTFGERNEFVYSVRKSMSEAFKRELGEKRFVLVSS